MSSSFNIIDVIVEADIDFIVIVMSIVVKSDVIVEVGDSIEVDNFKKPDIYEISTDWFTQHLN